MTSLNLNSILVLCGHVADLDNELVSIGREDAGGKPKWLAILVESGPMGNKDCHPAIVGQHKEYRFGPVGGPHCDSVPITSMLYAHGFFKIPDRALFYVERQLELPRATIDQVHWVE